MMDFKSEAEKLLEQLVMDWQAEMPMGRPIPEIGRASCRERV